MSRLEQFKRILSGFNDAAASLEGAALFSDDGLIIASNLSEEVDEMRLSAASSALLSTCGGGARDLRRGGLEELIIRGEGGYAILSSTSRNLVLLVLAGKTAKLGGVLLGVRDAIMELNQAV